MSFLSSLFCWRRRTHCATVPFWGSMAFTWNSVVTSIRDFLLIQTHRAGCTFQWQCLGYQICISYWHFHWAKQTQRVYAKLQYTCHSAVWQNGRLSQKNHRIKFALQGGNIISMFPSVDEQEDSVHAILVQLEVLEGQFKNYFPEADSWRRDKAWIQFPFRDNAADSARLTVTEEDQLVKLSTDSRLRIIYETKPLTLFWISCQKDFPLLSARAMKSLLCFAEVDIPHSPTWKTNTGQDCSLRLIGPACLTTTFHPRIKSFVCYTSGSDISLKLEWACVCLLRIHCPPTCININVKRNV